MKPKNFPGRKMARKIKAGIVPPPANWTAYTPDINLRVGRRMRDVNGVPKA